MLKKFLAVMALVLPLSFSAFAENMEKVNINSASAEILDKNLKYIGPNTAKRIVEFREEHGMFKSVEDMTEVRGVGMQVIKANRERLSIE